MDDCNKVRVILDEANAADYYELERIFRSGNISTEIVTKNTTGTEMGFEFSELIVLLPLLVPYVIQFRKILTAYWIYKKHIKKIAITLECNGKKLKIESNNGVIPDIDELMAFFGENANNISADENC